MDTNKPKQPSGIQSDTPDPNKKDPPKKEDTNKPEPKLSEYLDPAMEGHAKDLENRKRADSAIPNDHPVLEYALRAGRKPNFDVDRHRDKINELLHHPIVKRVHELVEKANNNPDKAIEASIEGDEHLRIIWATILGMCHKVEEANKKFSRPNSVLLTKSIDAATKVLQ